LQKLVSEEELRSFEFLLSQELTDAICKNDDLENCQADNVSITSQKMWPLSIYPVVQKYAIQCCEQLKLRETTKEEILECLESVKLTLFSEIDFED
jgi:hypothetical protein